jgi:tetratricopeptide (TPR) repeat protein
VENDAVANQFAESVGPLLESGDLPALINLLEEQWPPESLAVLLASSSPAVRSRAARCLGLTGSMSYCRHLADLLGHADQGVAKAAEDALWHIWMQAGSAAARQRLARAVGHIRAQDYQAAVAALDALLAVEPTFAEAHHQRAIALCFLGQPEAAAEAYQQTLGLNPHHFVAAVGLGHSYVERGDVRRALKLYRLALQLHPGLGEIREAVEQIETALRKRDVA